MNDEIIQWSSGISLEWALFSLAIGLLILAVVFIRIWGDLRKRKAEQGKK